MSVVVKLQHVYGQKSWPLSGGRSKKIWWNFQLKTFANWRHFGAADRSEIILHSFSSICVWLLTTDHINHNCGIARLRIKKQQKQSLSYKQGNTFKIKYYQFLSLEGIVDSVSCLCVERFLMGVDSNLMSATTRGDINHHHSSSSLSPSKIYWRKLASNTWKDTWIFERCELLQLIQDTSIPCLHKLFCNSNLYKSCTLPLSKTYHQLISCNKWIYCNAVSECWWWWRRSWWWL